LVSADDWLHPRIERDILTLLHKTQPNWGTHPEERLMNKARRFTVSVVALALFIGLAPASADAASGVIQIIDIRPILARHDIGNLSGLAFNPDLNVIYLSHGDYRGGFLYTLDMDGNLLTEVDFWAAYQPQAVPDSVSYDRDSGHLFVLVYVPVGDGFAVHLVEISPDGSTIFSDLTPIDTDGGGSIIVRADGLWQARFGEDVIRHYTRAGTFIEDISVAQAFPGFPGPYGLASSFRGGFFLVDFFGRRLVEVDGGGEEIAEASTATLPEVLGPGRSLAIDSDLDSHRIFLQVENKQIYILSPEFLRAFVNELVTLDSLDFACNSTPVPAGPFGTCTIRAGFTNRSADSVEVPVFLVRELGPFETNLLLNADGGPGGVGSELTPDVGNDGTLSPSESFSAEFVVGLHSRRRFEFFVDLLAEGVR